MLQRKASSIGRRGGEGVDRRAGVREREEKRISLACMGLWRWERLCPMWEHSWTPALQPRVAWTGA